MSAAIIPLNHASLQESILPHNFEAEQGLLGCLLLNNKNLESVSEFLKPQHFSLPLHGRLFEIVSRLISRNHVADPITLKDFFATDEDFIKAGGASYLFDLASNVLSLSNALDYATLIYDLFLRRELISLGEEMIQKAKNQKIDEEAPLQIESAERHLFDLATQGQWNTQTQSFAQALDKTVEAIQKASKRNGEVIGVTTGLRDLDENLGGLHRSDLLILAGRPSMGKTALATNIAFNAAQIFFHKQQEGAPVAFFSLEMSAEQLAGRLLAAEVGISSHKLRKGLVSKDEMPRIMEISRGLSHIPLFIDDTPGLSITGLRNRARRLKRQHNIGMIVIDYLQLLTVDGGSRRQENRVLEISEITRSLKALAKELDLPVLALSQLSRAVEQRDDKRPQLSDLRESGSIEQDADIVMFVFREEYYEERKALTQDNPKYLEWKSRLERIKNQAEVIIAKQRHGPVGTIHLYFNGDVTKFGNLAKNS
ncbi:MAG TPA: replicative DNA helicase [Alphaproteobacteria bacterium]|nr:replicative DNA helicase [Alphaproteobacteria bacterium]